MSVYIYVRKSATNSTRYIGITANLSRRLREHRGGHTAAGRLLGEFTLIYTEEVTDYQIAREREKLLKSGQGKEWPDNLAALPGPATGG
jgi:putative endonuclease